MTRTESGPFRDGQVHVLREKCETCIFRAGNLMHLQPGRVKGMVQECQRVDGGNIPCHETISGGPKAICRGFWDAYADQDWLMRLAKERNIIKEVAAGE